MPSMASRRAVILTPSRSPHPTQLLSPPTGNPPKSFSCNTYESLRKCCKQKTYGRAKSFSCNTYKKQGGGWGVLWLTRSPRLAHPTRVRILSPPTAEEPKDSSLVSLFSLFAARVFHNSFTTKRFHTLSENCRGVTLQFPFWEAHDQLQASNRHFFTSLPRCFPEPVDIQPFAGHNFPSAPSPRIAPITEEGE